jgi:hypothetical protein
MVFLGGSGGGRESVRARSAGSVFAGRRAFLNIREKFPRPRRPGQTCVFKCRQLDDLFHILKTVKGLLHLVPPRTPRSSGNGVLYTCGLCGYIEVHVNTIHLINIGEYPHKYRGHEDVIS